MANAEYDYMAQLVERLSDGRDVAGSTPAVVNSLFVAIYRSFGRMPKSTTW